MGGAGAMILFMVGLVILVVAFGILSPTCLFIASKLTNLDSRRFSLAAALGLAFLQGALLSSPFLIHGAEGTLRSVDRTYLFGLASSLGFVSLASVAVWVNYQWKCGAAVSVLFTFIYSLLLVCTMGTVVFMIYRFVN
jgi:hypothetical protein